MKVLLVALFVLGVMEGIECKRASKRVINYSANLPKVYDFITYNGETKDCSMYHRMDEAGNGCNCVFVGCTGSQECRSPSMACAIVNPNHDPQNLVSGDCKCRWLDNEDGIPKVVPRKKSSSAKKAKAN